MARCFSCGGSLSELDGIYRNTLCPHCGTDAKVCLNCRFYDKTAHWECRETIAESVRDKDRANFCDFFQLAETGATKAEGKGAKARDDFDKLFGNG